MFTLFKENNRGKDPQKVHGLTWLSVILAGFFPLYYFYLFLASQIPDFPDTWLPSLLVVEIIGVLSGPGAILIGSYVLLKTIRTRPLHLGNIFLAGIGIVGGMIAFHFFIPIFPLLFSPH